MDEGCSSPRKKSQPITTHEPDTHLDGTGNVLTHAIVYFSSIVWWVLMPHPVARSLPHARCSWFLTAATIPTILPFAKNPTRLLNSY